MDYVLALNPKEVVLGIDYGERAWQRTRSAEDDDDDTEPVFRIDRRTIQQDGTYEEQ